MKRTLLSAALVAAIAFPIGSTQAASFNYHGNLQDAGKPAEGSYDLELTLYSAPEGGKVLAGPLMMYKVPVHDGSFSTEADFGPLMNLKDQAWLGVKVRSADKGEFATLGARASIDASVTVASCPGAWGLQGNAGNQPDYYLGTSDSQPIVFKVNGNVAGQITPGKGVAFGQSGFGTSALGQDAFATGDGAFANGQLSFAAGFGVTAAQGGSYIWGDSVSGTGTITATTGANQYIVRATGGVGINGAPKNSDIELSIYPGASTVYNYSSVFMGNKADKGGMLISVGDETSTTSNDAAFYIDQFDGTNQTRKLIVNSDGLSINGTNTIDTIYHPALNVFSNGVPADVAVADFIPSGGSNGYFRMYGYTPSSTLALFNFEFADAQGTHPFMSMSDTAGTIAMLTPGSLNVGADLHVTGNAYKPGGGSWTPTSDRRIKQDIAPIHDALDTVMKLRPVNFRYTPEYRAMAGGLPDRPYAGFIAQEYAEVFPTDVVSTRDHVPGAAPGDPTILALDPNPALITTVAAVQELAVENASLHKQIDELVARLNKLEGKQGE